MTDYAQVLTELKEYEGSIWSIKGNPKDYNNLDWHEGNIFAKPTKEELDADYLDVLAILTQKKYSDLLQNHLDVKAQERDYKDAHTVSTYRDSTVEQWRKEAINFIKWRDDCWLHAYEVLDQVQNGEIDLPDEIDFIQGLPTLEWN